MGLQLLAATSFWTNPMSYVWILMVAAGLGFVIFVHELGHFLVAKACGVKCEKFLIGFDAFDIKIAGKVIIPRKLVSWKWGETEYAIGIVPLGGYVKMLGQDDNPAKAAEEIERAKIRQQQESGEADADGAKTASDEYQLDPRSYQAKSVPQRMAIISAGVVMNLIFAVIFATIGYAIGVPYSPCEIGATVPGGPAWEADIRSGDRVVQLSKEGEPNEQLRFRADLTQAIAMNGDQEPMHLLVKRPGVSEPFWVEVQPRKGLIQMKGMNYALIGVNPSSEPQFASENAIMPGSPIEAAGKFEDGDRIVAFNGEPITDMYQLRLLFALHSDQEVTLTVERSASESEESGKTRLDIQVQPNVRKRVGLAMKVDAISAVKVGSPADKAGLKVGDLLLAIDDQPIGDPMTLADRLRKIAQEGGSVKLRVLRTVGENEQEEKTITVTPRIPDASPSRTVAMYQPIAIEELGIAFPLLNWVEQVEPGSPAAQAEFAAGDKLTRVEFIVPEAKNELEEMWRKSLQQPVDVTEYPNCWPMVDSAIQRAPKGTKVKIVYLHDGQQRTAELDLVTDGEWGTHYASTRGFIPTAKEEILKAEGLGHALSLGLAQTRNDAFRVFGFLRKLVTGRISPQNLGGPGMIAVAATSEASQGPTRLLLFLTLLSANLAVVNFLPIPVLDGGHMVFLLYELVFRKPPNEKIFMALTLVGFAFIMTLMLFVIGMDVYRFTP